MATIHQSKSPNSWALSFLIIVVVIIVVLFAVAAVVVMYLPILRKWLLKRKKLAHLFGMRQSEKKKKKSELTQPLLFEQEDIHHSLFAEGFLAPSSIELKRDKRPTTKRSVTMGSLSTRRV
jgi:flagellar basal body-associated protein FliL